jgi:hypothetical protein
MPAPIYRKTDAGREEVGARKAGLSPVTRRVLIMVNGQDGVAALASLGLPDLQSHLDTLLAFRLIEPLSGNGSRPASPSAMPVTTAVAAAPIAPPAPAAPAAPQVDPEEDRQVQALQRKAFLMLRQHFGPDTPTVAQAVFAARTLVDFRMALDSIEAKLAIYMGRKQATRELDTLRGGL